MRTSSKWEDIRLILHYTGKIIIGVAALDLIPLATALASGEYASAVDFLLSFGAALTLGAGLSAFGVTTRRPGWMHGMVTAGVSWLVAMVVAALPYWLSGHYRGYLDCMFDVMSGLTTTGIVLIQDLDHISDSLNMWRHLLTFVGGQGIIVFALALFADGTGGGYGFYVGEGKDERLFPSVLHTAKAIWRISILYLVIGTAALWGAGIVIGLSPARAFLHGLWIYMAAWSTGGFAPMSQNILYYHSDLFEVITFLFFTVGSFNFALHSAVLRGDRKELVRNIETLSFGTTLSLLTFVVCAGLIKLHVYPDIVALVRKGFYQLASAHTTTGFMTVYPRQFATEWGDVAVFALIVAMLIGGSACSTAGGFKGLRIGILFKAIVQETRQMLRPNSAVVVQKFRYHGTKILSAQQVRSAALIVLMYVVIFAIATLAGCLAGYPLLDSAFESASVTGNVGLSIGISNTAMPAGLKIVYIFNMWAGRLEFMAILASLGFVSAIFKKRSI
ncbi:MAG: TrkH family potassium uptake protein [Rectinemataceae bacterium]